MLRNMEYVYEVYKERSFTRAAKNLYVTQPCLSALVKKTEEKLGFPIFNRSANPLQLTEYGKEYIRYIERMQALENEFENYLNDVRGLKTGRLSIGSNNAFSALVLPQIISEFNRLYPGVEVRLRGTSTTWRSCLPAARWIWCWTTTRWTKRFTKRSTPSPSTCCWLSPPKEKRCPMAR